VRPTLRHQPTIAEASTDGREVLYGFERPQPFGRQGQARAPYSRFCLLVNPVGPTGGREGSRGVCCPGNWGQNRDCRTVADLRVAATSGTLWAHSRGRARCSRAAVQSCSRCRVLRQLAIPGAPTIRNAFAAGRRPEAGVLCLFGIARTATAPLPRYVSPRFKSLGADAWQLAGQPAT
jgi:hypothetical protein